jgi:hypothetical protein
MELKEKILAAGIAIVSYLLLNNITGLIFVSMPQYDDCYKQYPYPAMDSSTQEYNDPLQMQREACQAEWTNKIAYNALLASAGMAVLGLVAIATGYFVIKLEPISTGLMGGGILALIQGSTIYYFVSKNQWEKTVLLVVAFIILLAIAYFKFAKKPKK